MGMLKNAYKILFGKREGKRPLGRPRLRLEDNIERMFGCGLVSVTSRQEPVTDPCDDGNESSGFRIGDEFHDKLIDSRLLKMDSAPWSWLVT
jgi:hypothetical protein